jgi:hypothetical protein
MSKQMMPLRQRMIEDMTIRNMAPSTQEIYVRAVANFSIFHGRSPDKLSFEDVRDYRLHLISRGTQAKLDQPDHGRAAIASEPPPCPRCGGRMQTVEAFDGPYSRPFHARRADAHDGAFLPLVHAPYE